jgi:hypothetical protein
LPASKPQLPHRLLVPQFAGQRRAASRARAGGSPDHVTADGASGKRASCRSSLGQRQKKADANALPRQGWTHAAQGIVSAQGTWLSC